VSSNLQTTNIQYANVATINVTNGANITTLTVSSFANVNSANIVGIISSTLNVSTQANLQYANMISANVVGTMNVNGLLSARLLTGNGSALMNLHASNISNGIINFSATSGLGANGIAISGILGGNGQILASTGGVGAGVQWIGPATGIWSNVAPSINPPPYPIYYGIGNVGIGNTLWTSFGTGFNTYPGAPLDVYGGSGTFSNVSDAPFYGSIRIQNNPGTHAAPGGLEFKCGTSGVPGPGGGTGHRLVASELTLGTGIAPLIWQVRSGTWNWSNALAVMCGSAYSGYVGIGTMSPLYQMHVYQTANTSVSSITSQFSNANQAAYLYLSNASGTSTTLYLNGPNNSADGPANSATLRNDAGDLRLAGRLTQPYIYLQSSTGRVGINTTTATQALDVAGYARIGSGGSDISRLILGRAPGTTNFDYASMIESVSTFASNYQSTLRFYTHGAAATGANPTLAMTIDPTQRVGIGIAPSYKFHVDNGSNSGINAVVQASGIVAGGTTSMILGKALSTNNSGTFLWNHIGDGLATNYLGLGYFGGDNKLCVTASGNVGIGVTNPLQVLHIYSGLSGNPTTGAGTGSDPNASFRLQMVSIGLDIGVYGGGATWIQNRQPGTSLGTTFPIAFQPIGGFFGIGTIPGDLLHILGTSNPSIRIDAGAGGTSDPRLQFYSGTAFRGRVAYSYGGGYMYYQNDTRDLMRFYNGASGLVTLQQDDTGNVSIGTTANLGRLHIYQGAGSVAGATSGTLVLDHGNSGGTSSICFPSRVNYGSDYAYIQYQDGATPGAGGESARLRIGTQNDADDHIILEPSGNVGINTNTPQYKFHVYNGDSSFAYFGPNATWGAYLVIGAGFSQVAAGKAQVITTNGNLHLDAGTGQQMYFNNYNTGSAINSWGTWTHNAAMTISGVLTANGNVGIGTASPLARFTIKNGYNDGAAGGLCIDATDGGVYNARFYSYFQGAGQVAYRWVVNNQASSVTAMTFGYNGNVGMGTDNPGYKLDVNGTLNVTGAVRMTDALVIQHPYPTITFQDTDSMSAYWHCNSNLMYLLRGGVNAGPGGWTPVNGQWPVSFNLADNSATFGGTIYSVGAITTVGSLNMEGNGTRIKFNTTATWSGDAAAGWGKLEYHSNRWYINSGSDSNRVVQFRRGVTDVSYIDNDGNFIGPGATFASLVQVNRLRPYSYIYGSGYDTAAIEVREYGLENATGGIELARAPRIGFHWGGRVASQIIMESSGRIGIWNNPGSAREAFTSGTYYCSGNVGINMEASYRFDCSGTGYFIQSQQSGYGWNRFTGYESSAIRAQVILQSLYSDLIISSSEANGTHGSTLSFVAKSTGNTDYRKFVINVGNWGTYGTGGYGDRMSFGWKDGAYINPHSCVSPDDSAMCINGRTKSVGINNVGSPGYNLHINGNDYATGARYTSDFFRVYGSSGGLYFENHGGGWTMTDATWIRSYNGKGIYTTGTIASTGDVVAYYSDMRLKKNIQPIEDALEKLMGLSTFTYEANEVAESLGYNSGERNTGFSAQEVKVILPEVVRLAPCDIGETNEVTKITESKSGENYMTLLYEKMLPLVVKALQEESTARRELQARVDALEKLLVKE
jgi:hypothetical protein